MDEKPLNRIYCVLRKRFKQNSLNFVSIDVKMNLQLRTCGEKSFTLALQLTNTRICLKVWLV